MDPSVEYCQVREIESATADARYLSRPSKPSHLTSSSGAGPIKEHSAVEKALYDNWLREWIADLSDLFSPLLRYFGTPEALLFANLDAVYNLTGRSGGYFASSELKAYKVFSASEFCVGALSYFLYRIPTAEFGLYRDRLLLPRWVDEMYWMPPFEPLSGMSEEEISLAILDRFKERIDLIVADESYPLQQIGKVLIAEGVLLVIVLREEAETLEQLFKRKKSFIADMARAFRELSIFVPLSLLGRGAVLVGKHPEQRNITPGQLDSYIKAATIDTSLWATPGKLDHSEALKCWNIC